MAQSEKNLEPIPTPFPLLVQRFRYQVLPALTMVAALALAVWLYVRNGGVYSNIGEVNIVRSTVSSKIDGLLARGDDAPTRSFQIHDVVREGELLARIDPGPIRAEINRYEKELEQLEDQLNAVTGGPATRPAGAQPPSTSDITALRIAIAAAEGKLRSLQEQLQHLDITAPIGGTITAIRALPGQAVRAGDPILTIASDKGQFIVSYVRTNQAIRPEPNMQVAVRVRSSQTMHSARVISVGPQVELVPEQQCRDPRIPEWGLPVHVSLPPGVSLRPGEIVDLVFYPRPAPTPPHVARRN
jgi:multidrug resistance efflux pump